MDKKHKMLSENVKVRRLYNQFKLFYRSKYGRTGFYILLGFVIISFLSPIIVSHPNYSYLAPEQDTHIPDLIGSANAKGINSSSTLFYPLETSLTVDSGVKSLYFGSSSGDLYFEGINGTETTPIGYTQLLFKCSNTSSSLNMQQPLVLSVINCQKLIQTGELSFDRYAVLPYNNGKILIGKVSINTASNKPEFNLISTVKYNGTLVSNVVSNAATLVTTLSGNDASIFSSSLKLDHDAQIFFVTKNSSGIYLNSYSMNPEIKVYTERIGSNNVSADYNLEFYGGLYTYNVATAESSIILYNNSCIESISAYSGHKNWNTTIEKMDLSIAPVIPNNYNKAYSSTQNVAFFVSDSRELFQINLSNGSLDHIFSGNSQLESLVTTPGAGGFPTYTMVSTAHSLILLSKNSYGNLTNRTIAISSIDGGFYSKGIYDSVSDSFVVISNKGVLLSVNLIGGSSTVFDWSYTISPTPKNTSAMIYFIDGNTGTGVLGELTPNNYVYILSASSINIDPIPPMAKTPSGASFFLGTNQDGNDIWAEFIESFYIDWEFGIGIGLATIFISVGVAMYIGYKGGLGGRILETVSLSLYLIPSLALLIALASILNGKASFLDLLLIISLTGWPFAAFTLMGVVRGIKSRTYVKASKLFGTKDTAIMRKHILPNIGPLLLYLLALSISGGVGAISGLQFLGIAPLLTPTWGGMLNGALVDYFVVVNSPQWIIPPAAALAMFIFSFIFISRGLDEVVNPRLRRR